MKSAASLPPVAMPALPRPRRPVLSVESVALAACLFFVLIGNGPFWQAALDQRAVADPQTWLFAACAGVVLVAFQAAVMLLVLNRWTAKPLLALLLVANACATYYMQKYGVVIDSTMMGNVLHTDWKEARELLSRELLWHVLWQALLPFALLALVHLKRRPWGSALRWRLGTIAALLLVASGALLLVFQDASALVRNHKSTRFLITPANYVYALGRSAKGAERALRRERLPLGTDARLGPGWQARHKPALLVLVVGETARAANWGLNGYSRQTTPELAALDVINFRDVKSCGTNTEVSVPCMFSREGRRHYDEESIHAHESLLHVLNRAGFKLQWRDNQSGCKGVCDGLPKQQLDRAEDPGLCHDGLCLDEILLRGLDTVARDANGNLVVVLHQLGNHGPAYFKRYPSAFHRYGPTCDTAELRECTPAQIVNAYDNAIGYTDHVLAETIRFLQSQQQRYDTAMLYVSDHGESLSEHNLFLHGMPYAIAPEVQTHVPMVMWMSPGYASSFHVDTGCLRERAQHAASHDNLFDTVLGLLDVQTLIYDRSMDLSAGCRS
jgi:lipid A ethanolaminephosphotransferase